MSDHMKSNRSAIRKPHRQRVDVHPETMRSVIATLVIAVVGDLGKRHEIFSIQKKKRRRGVQAAKIDPSPRISQKSTNPFRAVTISVSRNMPPTSLASFLTACRSDRLISAVACGGTFALRGFLWPLRAGLPSASSRNFPRTTATDASETSSFDASFTFSTISFAVTSGKARIAARIASCFAPRSTSTILHRPFIEKEDIHYTHQTNQALSLFGIFIHPTWQSVVRPDGSLDFHVPFSNCQS